MTGTERVNFVSDLVAMARAYDELPQVQEALTNELGRNEELRQTVQHLELRIMELKGDLDKAHEFGRKLEAERDDAELRFLECEEKLGSYTSIVRNWAASLGMVDKPEPAVVATDSAAALFTGTPVVEHEPMPVVGQSEADPTPTTDASYTSRTGQETASMMDAGSLVDATGSTLTEASASATPDPTAPSTTGDGPSSADAQSVSDGESASTSEGRYRGKTFFTMSQELVNEFWEEFDAQRSNWDGLKSGEDFWIANGGDSYGWNH